MYVLPSHDSCSSDGAPPQVLRGLSAEEVGEARALLWDYWEALDDRISRTDASTWGRMDAFMHKDTGIVNSYGIGQVCPLLASYTPSYLVLYLAHAHTDARFHVTRKDPY